MKKNLPLILILALCGLVMAGGVAAVVVSAVNNASLSSDIEKNEKKLKSLRNRKTLALSEENRRLGDETVAALKKAAEKRVAALVQPKRLDTDFNGDATQLVSNLMQRKSDWLALCQGKNIELADAARSFGFARYLDNNETAPAEHLKALDLQIAGVNEILGALVLAHEVYDKNLVAEHVMPPSEKTYMKILGIEREGVELSPAQRRSMARGEFFVDPVAGAGDTGFCRLSDGQNDVNFVSLRREGAARATAFRVKFVADSGVFRYFVRRMEDYAIYVRDVSAQRATPDQLPPKNAPAAPQTSSPAANPFDLFGGAAPVQAAQAAPRVPARRVVVESIPETFTVTLEYVSPVLPRPEKKGKEKSE
ncbi:MAG: hypothetical protein ACI4QA_02415 [Candidatus Spyradosoma sp.]